ncbi:MAG: filamentous hemagglutinin N-terminal domain-containing protein, partial [Candidatus Hydrogenedentes bacterium]|nr:filamentous hemagglutinin N-terminal domain-containing protein [Candidatus Hydrogenedentota bacterium]
TPPTPSSSTARSRASPRIPRRAAMPRSTEPRRKARGGGRRRVGIVGAGVGVDGGVVRGLGVGTAIVAFAFAFALALASSPSPVAAQVVFDDTLTTPGEAPLDPGGTTWQIEADRGVTRSGGGQTNLFYSFERFDVPTAHAAEFRPGAEVDAIVSRVTGGDLSRIDGNLRVSA